MYVIKARTHGCVRNDSETHSTGVTGLHSRLRWTCNPVTQSRAFHCHFAHIRAFSLYNFMYSYSLSPTQIISPRGQQMHSKINKLCKPWKLWPAYLLKLQRFVFWISMSVVNLCQNKSVPLPVVLLTSSAQGPSFLPQLSLGIRTWINDYTYCFSWMLFVLHYNMLMFSQCVLLNGSPGGWWLVIITCVIW